MKLLQSHKRQSDGQGLHVGAPGALLPVDVPDWVLEEPPNILEESPLISSIVRLGPILVEIDVPVVISTDGSVDGLESLGGVGRVVVQVVLSVGPCLLDFRVGWSLLVVDVGVVGRMGPDPETVQVHGVVGV